MDTPHLIMIMRYYFIIYSYGNKMLSYQIIIIITNIIIDCIINYDLLRFNYNYGSKS